MEDECIEAIHSKMSRNFSYENILYEQPSLKRDYSQEGFIRERRTTMDPSGTYRGPSK